MLKTLRAIFISNKFWVYILKMIIPWIIFASIILIEAFYMTGKFNILAGPTTLIWVKIAEIYWISITIGYIYGYISSRKTLFAKFTKTEMIFDYLFDFFLPVAVILVVIFVSSLFYLHKIPGFLKYTRIILITCFIAILPLRIIFKKKYWLEK